jgi:hypothetical protein
MRSVRPVLAAALFAGALLVLPTGKGAGPGAVQQPGKRQQRALKLLLQQQQARNLLLVKKRKKHHHGISGTVVSIHRNKQARGTGTIKLAVHHHRHRKVNPQAAVNPAAKAAKKAVQVGAIKVGQQKKRRTHTVKIRFGNGTKFAVTVKGLVAGKPKVVTVGSGKNKGKVAVPTAPKMATRHLPTGSHALKKGQHVRVSLHAIHRRTATSVRIIHPSAMPPAK